MMITTKIISLGRRNWCRLVIRRFFASETGDVGKYSKNLVEHQRNPDLKKTVYISKTQRQLRKSTETNKYTVSLNNKRKRSELFAHLTEHKYYTCSEWEEMKRIAIANREVTELGFEGFAMGLCVGERNFESAKSLMDHLENKQIEPNVATLSRFLLICSRCVDKAGEDLLLKVYDSIKPKMKDSQLDVTSLNSVILGVSKTNRWRECVDIIEFTESLGFQPPSSAAYNSILKVSLKNGFDDTSSKILDKMATAKTIPSANAFNEWINYCMKETLNFEELLDQVIEYWRKYRLEVPLAVADKLKNSLESVGGNHVGDYVTVDSSGSCPHCEEKLERSEMKKKDFTELSETLLNKVLRGENEFVKTNPKELAGFKKFVAQTKPYDYVLDGLNIGYKKLGFTPNRTQRAERLLDVVTQLVGDKKKVLIVGTRAIKSWPPRLVNRIRTMAHMFLTDALSKDDLFLLYAALVSGDECFVVSMDMMRDHKYCFQDEHLKNLFRDWQWSHQLDFADVGGRICIMPPLTYKCLSQKTERSIHIPVTDGLDPSVITTVPTKWLCVKKESKFD